MAIFPSSPRVAARSRKRREASLARADGVVFNLNKILGGIGSPPRPLHKGGFRDILLRSRPPLGEEGKIADLCVWATDPFSPSPGLNNVDVIRAQRGLKARDYIADCSRRIVFPAP
jgi:hypothetical protein